MGLEFNRDKYRDIQYNLLFNRYSLLALNIFEWKNLPNKIESRHIEKALYHNGQAIFFDDKDLGLICLPCGDGGFQNIYGEDKIVIANSFGSSFSKQVNVDNCLETIYGEKLEIDTGIRIINNDLMISSIQYVKDFTQKMYEVELAINLNVEQQKFPYIIGNTNSKNELSLKNMMSKVRQGEPLIFTSKNISLDEFKVFDLNVPYITDKLNQYKFELEREILTFFGLNNNYEKKERLLVDEINSNNDYISRNVELMYKCRLKACEEINKKYNLNITVEKVDLFHNSDLTDETLINNLKLPKGGKSNVEIL